MTRPWIAVLSVALALTLAVPQASRGHALGDRVKVHTLGNGMKFLLLERHQSPTIAFSMRFKVGASDEWAGVMGTAHLLEHMLFKGTHTLGTKDIAKELALLDQIGKAGDELDREKIKHEKADAKKVEALTKQLKDLEKKAHEFVVKDEIDEIYTKNGGVGFNATTDQDLTTYFVSLPSNRLEMWARIEADRMTSPVLREFYSERDVVMEERRMRTDASPSGMVWEQFGAAAYIAHPYGFPVIGWASEIQSLSRLKTEEFRRIFYAPNNTIAAIVGDFDTARTIPILERYFGPIKAQELPRPPSVIEPDQIGERRIAVERDAEPEVTMGWHKPNMPHRDDYVFDVITSILSNGRSSRLYKDLVKEKQIAVEVGTYGSYPGSRYPNLFLVEATPRAPHTVAEVETAIYAQLERLKTEPVPAREMQKVQNQLEASYIRSLDSNDGLASQLTMFQALADDWAYLENHSKVIRTITPQEVMAVARKYLTQSNRTVAVLVKKAAEPAPTAPASAQPSAAPGK